MKNLIYTLSLLLLVSACTSINKLVEKGEYERAFALGVKKLQGKKNRKARFKTVICLILKGEKYFFEGFVEGEIIDHLRGNSGFGYDPIFIPNTYEKTFAELSLETKNTISHRGKAVKKLVDFLLGKKIA